jgi:UDP-glucose 4-epimerase
VTSPRTTPRSLVTGCAGFIGSHVADSLISLGHDVVGLDDLSGGVRPNVPAAVRFVQGSITDRDCVHALFEEHRFDHVFHFAAYAAEGLSHFIRRFNYTNNVIGSVTLINEAVSSQTVKSFVFASSIAVYGHAAPPATEETPLLPADPYGIAKLAVELDLKAASELFGLKHVIFRLHNVYGERQNIADRYRNVVGIFMNQALRGEPMTIFGDGRQRRAFTHVSAVAPIVAQSAHRADCQDQTFNLGSDEVCSVVDLAHLVAEAMDVEPRVTHLAPRQEVVEAYSSHEKAARCFGDMGAHLSLRDGLRRMAGWVKQQGALPVSRFGAIEVTKNLPLVWRAGA